MYLENFKSFFLSCSCGSLLPVENLRHTSVADTKLPADDTGPDPGGGHLDDLQPDVVGKRPTVDKHTTELVHPSLTFLVSGPFVVIGQRQGWWRGERETRLIAASWRFAQRS